jgi:hypothetical protein
MKPILIISLIISTLPISGVHDPTLAGTEQIFSRTYLGLVGPVRTVLTVSKRPEATSARTFSTTTETFEPNGAINETLYHSADIEHHSGKLVSLDSSRSYEYDSNRKLIRSLQSSPDGSYSSREEFRYDPAGRLTEIRVIEKSGTITEKSLLAYDHVKRQTTVTWLTYYGKPATTYFVYTFDPKGRATERTTLNADRSLNHRIVFSYHSNGNLAKEVHFNERNESVWGHIYSYKLDAKGNWFEQEKLYTQSDREPSIDMVTYRVITYYGEER